MNKIKTQHTIAILLICIVLAILFWFFNGFRMMFGRSVKVDSIAQASLRNESPVTYLASLRFGEPVNNKGPYLRREKMTGGLLLIKGGSDKWDATEEEIKNYYDESKQSLKEPSGKSVKPLPKKNYFFEYDRETKKPMVSSQKTWDEATGEIVDCTSQERQGYELATNNLIGFTNNKFSAYGTYLLGSAVSPSREKIVVVSADGPKLPNTGYAVAGVDEIVWGNRYVEMFSLTGNKPLGKVVRLGGFTSNQRSFLPCWSKDEEFVFVYTSDEGLWVIETTE